MIMPLTKTFAQNPLYSAIITHDSLISPTEYILDVYLQHTGGSTTFELSQLQIGIKFDSTMKGSGTIVPTLIPGYSDIVATQQQTNGNLFIVGTTTLLQKTLKVTPKTTSAGLGTIISQVSPGTRAFRVKLTNSIPYVISKANLIWSFTVPPTSWATIVNAYLGTVGTNITVQGSHTTVTDNPYLNKPIHLDSLRGITSYCQGSNGTSLTFYGTETGVRYHLIKNGVADLNVITGTTGTPIVWNNITNGTYTVGAHRIATYIDTTFLNTFIVTEDLPTVAGTVTGGSTILSGNSTGTLTLGAHTGTIIKWQKRIDGGAWIDIAWTQNTYSETPAPGTWDYRAVIKNGNCTEENSVYTTVIVTIITNTAPVISTNAVTNISSVSATLGGNISSNGGATITSSGVVYSLTANPTIGGPGCISISTSPTTTNGNFSLIQNSLTPCSTYYVKAWAINSVGTGYGSELTFLTSCSINVFNVTGGGSYCSGSTGATVGLSGSEIGITYQLIKDGANTGAPLNGTGSALTWTNQTAGTYTITANNGVTTTAMFGSVIITATTVPTITAVTSAAICGPGILTLTATASNGTINWYDSLTGGVSIFNGTSFSTPSLSVTRFYYVDATYNGCTTTVRVRDTATIKPIPNITSVTGGSRCGTGTVTLAATASGGTINWWFSPTGGTSLGTGSPFTTSSLSITSTYHVDATLNGCTTTSRSPVVATILPVPTINSLTATPTALCDSGTFSLASTATAGSTLNWYNVATGGTSLGTGSTYNTPVVHATTTYWVDATGTNACVSARSSVVATINLTPSILTTTPGFVCNSGPVTMSATTSGGVINWFTAPSGGTSVHTGLSYTTGDLLTTATYYVEGNNNGCISESRTAVVAEVRPVPTITSTTPGSRCGIGTDILSATASSGTINWYQNATGGVSMGTGSPWTTISISASTIFYVSTTNNGCTSARTAVFAYINLIPTVATTTPGVACGMSSAILGATPSSGVINWYASPTDTVVLYTGNSFTTPVLSTTTTYYAQASNSGCLSLTRVAVVATANPIPTVTSVSPGSRCGTGTVVLNATPSGGVVRWYSSATGGAILATNSTFTTPSIAGNTVYWAEAFDLSCPSSPRTPDTAFVNVIPTITATVPGSSCGAGTVTLGATASAGTINWYTTSTGGTSIATGTSYTTGSLSITTPYYVDATFNGCTTAIRVAVYASINSTPSILTTTPNSRCGAGTMILSATTSGGTINWWLDATGGTSLGIGGSFTTSVIAVTDTFWVDAVAGACPTPARIPVIATIKPIPTITATTPATTCGQGSVTLSATASAGTVNWYTTATGATLITTGNSYTTSVIASNTTYYVDATLNGCTTTTRVPVVATIHSVPVITAPVHDTVCGNTAASLGVTTSEGVVSWFTTATGGTAVGTGTTFTTPALTITTTYYAEALDSGCTSTPRTAVLATFNPITVGGHVSVLPIDDSIPPGHIPVVLTLTGYTGSIIHWEHLLMPSTTFNTMTPINTTNTCSEPAALNTLGRYDYRVLLKSGICPTAYSDTVHVWVINTSIDEAGKEAPIYVYSYDRTIFIQNQTSIDIKEVIVYNIAGQQITSIVPEKNDLIQIPMNVATANYIVKVITKKQAYSAKVFLR